MIRARRRFVLIIAVAAAGVLGTGIAVGAITTDGQTRQQVVAERGAEVMPFDLDATTHRFVPTVDGGVQTVVADNPAAEQVRLVQSHLQAEAEAFARGDFGDPARIHGTEMPGLAVLQASVGSLGVEYRVRDDGAELEFTSADPVVVAALHDWFAAQVSDHGSHAE